MHNPPTEFGRKASRFFCVTGIALAALALLISLVGCAAQTHDPDADRSASDANASDLSTSARLDDLAQLQIDKDTWNAFAANATSSVLGVDSDPLLAADASGNDSVADGGSASDGAVNNSCFSPLSLYFALALVADGTSGEAQSQVLELLGQQDKHALNAFCKAWIDRLQNTDASVADDGSADPGNPYSLKVANSIWAGMDYRFNELYANEVEDALDASVHAVEFGTQGADGEISGWISEKTEGLIVPEIRTSADQVATLINALYFKDAWVSAFEASDTAPDVFHAQSGDVQASFMHSTIEDCGYVQGGDFEAVSLGFQGGASFNCFLPNDGVDVEELLTDSAAIEELLNAQFEIREVTVSLPKFTIDTKFDDLIPAMQALGVTDVFDPNIAGMFDGMLEPSTQGLASDANSSENFYISDAIQETHIALDEEGAEAAAYTMLDIKTTTLLPEGEPVNFIANRPFAYTLTSPEGVVLFAGYLVNPQA